MFKAGSDKIRLKLPSWLDLPTTLERAFTRLGLRDRQCKPSPNKHGLRLYSTVTQQPSGILIELHRYKADRFKFITIKPVDTDNVYELFYYLFSIFGSSILDAEIIRFDYCVDYQVSTLTALMGIKIKYKRATDRFQYDRGIRTGAMFGKYPEVIVVYDKSKEMRATDGIDRTRIEVQLYKDKKPIRSLREISKCFMSKKKFVAPFRNIELQKIDFVNESSFINDPRKYRRFIELKTLCEETGYNIAKQRLNHNGNFVRDYVRPGFFTISNLVEHPDVVLEKAFTKYFDGWNDSYVCLSTNELFEKMRSKI